VVSAWRDNGLRRINYEVLGNSLPVLHGYVHARYPQAERNDPAWTYSDADHGELRAAIAAELHGLMERAYSVSA